MVQRYDGIDKCDDGAFVYYDDYAALERERDELLQREEVWREKKRCLENELAKEMAENAVLKKRLEPIREAYLQRYNHNVPYYLWLCEASIKKSMEMKGE